jgi:uncharacterized membrane protein YfcA
MPTNVKLLLSVLVVVASAAMFYFQRDLGNIVPSYVALLVGLLMILGMWIFPEVKKLDTPTLRQPPAGPSARPGDAESLRR